MSVPAPLFKPAPDDVGAQTADRYDWQALNAAVDCIAAISERSSRIGTVATDVWVICEHHEDYILCIADAVQLVSVKHRELGLGGWSRATLFTDGGVAHLFHRWLDLHEVTSARVATNAGLSQDVARLSDLCIQLRQDSTCDLDERESQDLVDAAIRIIGSTAPAIVADLGWKQNDGSPSEEFVACVRRFLGVLTLDSERPHRAVLPSAAASMYAAPFLSAIGRDPSMAVAAWSAIANLFRQRMRGHVSPEIEGLQNVIRNIHGLTNEERIAHQLNDRTISAVDVLEALDVTQALGLSPVDVASRVAPTRLALKLVNAGCQETTIHAAEAAAQRWRSHESALSHGAVGMSPVLERIKTHTLLIASGIHETEAVASGGADYGPRMWQRLRDALSAAEVADDLIAMDDDLALGLASDLLK